MNNRNKYKINLSDAVEIKGLQGNNTGLVCGELDPMTGKYDVKLENGSIISVRGCDLKKLSYDDPQELLRSFKMMSQEIGKMTGMTPK